MSVNFDTNVHDFSWSLYSEVKVEIRVMLRVMQPTPANDIALEICSSLNFCLCHQNMSRWVISVWLFFKGSTFPWEYSESHFCTKRFFKYTTRIMSWNQRRKKIGQKIIFKFSRGKYSLSTLSIYTAPFKSGFSFSTTKKYQKNSAVPMHLIKKNVYSSFRSCALVVFRFLLFTFPLHSSFESDLGSFDFHSFLSLIVDFLRHTTSTLKPLNIYCEIIDWRTMKICGSFCPSSIPSPLLLFKSIFAIV